MPKNTKKTSPKVASHAAKTLQDPAASKTAKKLAASALSQSSSDKQTGSEMEEFAAKVLKSEKYSDGTKTLAASVVSQSNKKR
ncbi:hypothetical protein L2750_20355 [Shewanella submarina]|uniref:SMP domain-containing protein n=1 Tax=Shewanella submarina TaxID=2016376 RepID=A0ABV7GBU5_9GAMM|nr:hypothetical protein [Shewanella submarina]MCL1039468.1 hypothetical protein [Shewanella submarina]